MANSIDITEKVTRALLPGQASGVVFDGFVHLSGYLAQWETAETPDAKQIADVNTVLAKMIETLEADSKGEADLDKLVARANRNLKNYLVKRKIKGKDGKKGMHTVLAHISRTQYAQDFGLGMPRAKKIVHKMELARGAWYVMLADAIEAKVGADEELKKKHGQLIQRLRNRAHMEVRPMTEDTVEVSADVSPAVEAKPQGTLIHDEPESKEAAAPAADKGYEVEPVQVEEKPAEPTGKKSLLEEEPKKAPAKEKLGVSNRLRGLLTRKKDPKIVQLPKASEAKPAVPPAKPARTGIYCSPETLKEKAHAINFPPKPPSALVVAMGTLGTKISDGLLSVFGTMTQADIDERNARRAKKAAEKAANKAKKPEAKAEGTPADAKPTEGAATEAAAASETPAVPVATGGDVKAEDINLESGAFPADALEGVEGNISPQALDAAPQPASEGQEGVNPSDNGHVDTSDKMGSKQEPVSVSNADKEGSKIDMKSLLDDTDVPKL